MLQQVRPDLPVGMTGLLATKLAQPRLRTSLVPRRELLARLAAGADRKLTLVRAPAGFGKTSLVREWLAQTSLPVGWLALDEGDNDLTRFWRYLIATCQQIDPEIGETALALLLSHQQPRFQEMLPALLNDLTRLSERAVIVLDDYHLIESAQIGAMMTYFIDQLPETLHLVMISRGDPQLSLARLRAHDEVNELRAEDLRLSRAEIEVFLSQAVGYRLSETAVSELERLTEGWVVGLRLMTLALQNRHPSDVDRLLAAFSVDHRPILDYLLSEVLAAQSETTRQFVLETVFFDRLNGPLCAAVTGRSDSDEALAELERANLFLNPIGDQQEWYRFHALAAEALRRYARQALSSAEVRELHERGSRWFEGQGLLAEAIETALRGELYSRAANLIERVIDPQLVQRNHEYFTLRRWIAQLPEDVLAGHPHLCLYYGIALLFTSDRQAPGTAQQIEKSLTLAEQQWQADGNEALLGETLAFRTLVQFWQGDYQNLFATARRALACLGDDQIEWRGIMRLNLAMEAWLNGSMKLARERVAESKPLIDAADNEYAQRSTLRLLGKISLTEGRLYEAEQHFQALHERSTGDPHERAHALIGLGTVALERNQVETAARCAKEGMALSEQLGDRHILLDATTLLAQVIFAEGNAEEARRLAASFARSETIPVFVREARAREAWYALASGDFAAARGWEATYGQKATGVFTLEQEREALIYARLLIAGDEIDAALRLLDDWQADARTGQRTRSELEIAILKALAYYADRQLAPALSSLRWAVETGYERGYLRVFLQEGETVLTLLNHLSTQDSLELTAYVQLLTRAFSEVRARNEVSGRVEARMLADQLSPQEQRVFFLIADGQSNPEIAISLGVSVNTIKTQVKSIYSKLNLRSRKQAREMARSLLSLTLR